MINTGGKEQVTIEQLQQRIAELEDERMDAAMLDQYRIWYAKEEAKVKRLDAALAEIIMLTGLDNPLLERAREIALKARAGDGD
jgi:hypothetical protein